MARVVTERTLNPDEVALVLTPRDDSVHERPTSTTDGSHHFEAVSGPFTEYHRTVTLGPVDPDGRRSVTEATDFKLAIPIWGFLFIPAVKYGIRHRRPAGSKTSWWEPPDRMDARASSVLALLCTVAVVAGYLGTVLTQTLTFAADEFDASDAAQGRVFAVVRAGVLLSLVLIALADRKGRRVMLLFTAAVGCVAAATGAFVPNLVGLTVSQGVARAFSTTVVVLLAVVAAEEMPAGARAYAVSVMTLTGALGGGMAVWALPLADMSTQSWRLLYVLPLVYLPLLLYVWRRLPESQRFAVTHAEVQMTGHGRRLMLIATTLFLTSLFSQPASQLQNEFLRDERSFSAGRISLFILLTTTPGGIGIVAGGRLAETIGRRWVTAVAVVGGAAFTVASFLSEGWPMWAFAMAGVMLGAAAVPALGIFGPELFPTSLRGRANGVIQTVAVLGSAVGLLTAGRISDQHSLGRAMAILLVGPVIVGVLMLIAYPETAHQELEALNPEDRAFAQQGLEISEVSGSPGVSDPQPEPPVRSPP